jgi:hypothetical protein
MAEVQVSKIVRSPVMAMAASEAGQRFHRKR